MTDILGIGVSALLANRTALDVAGQNIANVNTDGYSRQRVDLGSRSGTSAGSSFTGAGVTVQSVQRLGNAYLFARELGVASSSGRSAVLSDAASRLDSLLSGADTGLGTPLNSFFSSLSALSANPASTATRSGVLSAASALTARFQMLQGQLDSDGQAVNQQLAQGVSDVNADAQAIADLNRQIVQARGAQGQAPNELLDQRDQRVRVLAQKLRVTTVAQDDGALNVFIANGPALVLGANATSLRSVPNEFDATRTEVADSQGNVISAGIGGGSLGGLLDTRRQLLDPTSAQLGQLALTLASAVNAQQAQGVDRSGRPGQALLTVPAPTVSASARNTGTASVAAGIDDPSALGSGDYTLSFDGSRWTLADATTGASVGLSGSGTATDPWVGGGLRLSVSGPAASGDRFRIAPTRGAAGRVDLATRDPGAIAAASPIKATALDGNTGTLGVEAGSVVNASEPALTTPATIRFLDAGSYSINGSGRYAYGAGSPISVNGWSVAVSGTPAAGDGFSVGPTGADSSDNRNAAALAALATKAMLNGGLDTLGSAQARLVGQVGAQSQQASLQLSAQQTLQAQTTSERSAAAGVNLDEEAADLVRFQQAYQASAQIIAIAGTVFDSLLAATRR